MPRSLRCATRVRAARTRVAPVGMTASPKREELEMATLDHKSPPFAKFAKDGAPSRSFDELRNEWDPRTDLKIGHYTGGLECRAKARHLRRRYKQKTAAYLISITSFSLWAERSSIFLVSAWESFSSSSRARFCSSWLIFLSFSSLSMASLESRRMLRTAVR
jgi:hypothetical protein